MSANRAETGHFRRLLFCFYFFFAEPDIFALMSVIIAGSRDMTRINTITSSKCFCTTGIPPKKCPISTNSVLQTKAPRMLNGVNLRQRIPDIPDMNGMNVRINGKKRLRNTASGPHFSIIFSVFSSLSGVIALTFPESIMRFPNVRPI